MISLDQVKADFDEIAGLADAGESGSDRYDGLLASLVPLQAKTVLEIGCGMGRLTRRLAGNGRQIVGLDLSPAMIARARLESAGGRVTFLEGDFLDLSFDGASFDCVITAAALHHMPHDVALQRMINLVRPGGRLVVQDLRRDSSLGDSLLAYSAFAQTMIVRFIRTGRPRASKALRHAWERHRAREAYLSLQEARALVDRHLPGGVLRNHWMWRYTIVWDKPLSS